MTKHQDKRLVRFLPLLILFSIFLAEQIRILVSTGSQYTNEDQTLLWYAGKQFLHGKLHEPNFYGQQYNTIFEAVPGAWLHHLGTSLGVAVPLGTMIIVTLIWLLLSLTALSTGKYKTALLALAIPVIIRLQYLILFDAPRGILSGDLLAALAIVFAFWIIKEARLKLAFIICLGGLAILWDYATALIVVPAAIYLLTINWKEYISKPIKSILTFIIAAIPPVMWLAGSKYWYHSHPYDLTAPSISSVPHWNIFIQSVKHFDSFVAFYAPALAPVAVVGEIIILLTVVSVLLIAIKRKSKPLLFSTLSLILLVCIAISFDRAATSLPDLYLSNSRLLLTLPMALWLLVYLTALGSKKRKHSSINATIILLIVVLAVASFVVGQTKYTSITNRALDYDKKGLLTKASRIDKSCYTINQTYLTTGAQLYATNDRNLAYGCAAEYTSMNTLEPAYDRRGWIINEAYSTPITSFLTTGVSCSIPRPKDSTCKIELGNVVLIKTPPTTAASSLAQMGLKVKNFTPGSS